MREPTGGNGRGFVRSVRPLFSRQGFRGPVSDHFDGKQFHNLDKPEPHKLPGYLLWRLNRLLFGVGRWPRWRDATPGPAPPAEVTGGRLRLTWVNHATVLLQANGVNVLTDPIWSERASPVSCSGPRRRRPPGIRFEDLPRLDAVLVSHNHYDHLDLPTLARLTRAGVPRFLTGLGNGRLLEANGIGPVQELDWWQDVSLPGGVRITCVPARHFSSRGLNDRDRTLWCGFVMGGPSGSAYFAGDTGLGSHFREVARRLGPLRLMLLPIGAYRPRWFMGPVHLAPDEAVRVHGEVGAGTTVAIHYGTFPMADDGEEEPLAELRQALASAGEAARTFRVLDFGEGRDVP